MRIKTDNLSFEVPEGFEDATNYTFKGQGDQELLTVGLEPRPKEAISLAGLLKLRRRDLEALPGAPTIESEADTTVDGMKGRLLTFTFDDRDTKYRERWAFAFPTPDVYLQISYVTPASDEKAIERFNHVLSSVVLARKTVATPTPAGYVRRWAKRITLDVPSSLAAPRAYQFISREDRDCRFLVTVQDPKLPSERTLDIKTELARDSASGIVSDIQSQSINPPHGAGTLTRYVIKRRADSAIEARVAELILKNGMSVGLSLRGLVRDSSQLQETFNRFLESIQGEVIR